MREAFRGMQKAPAETPGEPAAAEERRREPLLGEKAEEPPPGFQITEGGDGRWTVRYGLGGIEVARALVTHEWQLSATIMAALLGTIGVGAFGPGGVWDYILLALGGLGLFFLVFGFGFAVWMGSSVRAFTFGAEDLVVVRSRLGSRQRWEFRQGEVRSVAQVQEGETSLWTLEVTSSSRVKVLPWQPMDSTRWLGSRIAQWAGVPLETLRREEPGPFEWL
jgi:hypothetical protein